MIIRPTNDRWGLQLFVVAVVLLWVVVLLKGRPEDPGCDKTNPSQAPTSYSRGEAATPALEQCTNQYDFSR